MKKKIIQSQERDGYSPELRVRDKILDYVLSLFPSELEDAMRIFEKKHGEHLKDVFTYNDFIRDYEAWFMLEHVLPNGATPIQLAFSNIKEAFSSEDEIMVRNFLNFNESLFEVRDFLPKKKECFLIDIKNKEEYIVKIIDSSMAFKVGNVLLTKIVKKFDGYYFFYGGIMVHKGIEAAKLKNRFLKVLAKEKIFPLSKEFVQIKKIGERDKLIEAQRKMIEDFKKYFGDYEVVFETLDEMETKITSFFNWRNKKLATHQKDNEVRNSIFELKIDLKKKFPNNLKNIGLIADALGGFVIIPYYSYIKQFFEGDYEKVPNYRGFFKNIIISNDSPLPSPILRRFILKFPERALEVFRKEYNNVNNVEDIFEILEDYRIDWNEPLEPHIVMLDDERRKA